MPKGTPLGDISNGKVCPSCQEHKPLTGYYKNRQNANGYTSHCKKCRHEKFEVARVRDPGYVARKGREWRKNNPERARDLLLRYNYGIEPGAYAKMFAAQGGRCKICRTDKAGGRGTALRVDHCHETKNVRGLLCNNCNLGLGHFFSSPELLRSAIDYLAKGG